MKSFLVIGMGRFGTAVAQELTELGQEVLAIDENVESVQRIFMLACFVQLRIAKVNTKTPTTFSAPTTSCDAS